MPYIPHDWRKDQQPHSAVAAETPGDLNFQMVILALDYLETHGTSYRAINDIMGAFDCAAREFYRRIAAPYEDVKIMENGDVF